MIYNIRWVEVKNDDWKVVSLVDAATSGDQSPVDYKDISVNRKSKSGELFPNFDDIQAGRDIEGDIWKSPTGKWYLFAPKPKKVGGGGGGAFKQAQIKEVMDKKNEFIGKTLDRKEDAIKLASSQRDAVLMVSTLINSKHWTTLGENDYKRIIIEWRNWFLLSRDFNDIPPFD